MPNPFKTAFLEYLTSKYGKPKKLAQSLSLYEIGNGVARIYIRYSRIHNKNKSFYGLRKEDLKRLEGFNSVICFLWDTQTEPAFIPYADFEEIFSSLTPASDGQYKVQIYHNGENELYIANAGRFNIEGFIGWHNLDDLIDKNKLVNLPDFSHSQIQTFIGSIGSLKGYDLWIPSNDRNKLDWDMADKFFCRNELPTRYEKIINVIKEIDVIWLKRGSSELKAMFEVEHSTPIYSGLLRFNDLYLAVPNLKSKFSIVSNDIRRSLFLSQVNRPTFRMSGLSDICN
ncbi:MAG TPA: hypothetical protein ENH25_01915, partial [candidate division Zixibacteria bacterium]|nr:hypothetical protein [candidate division Zixibacteria bacterium]